MTPETDRRYDVRKIAVTVLAFLVLAGIGYVVVTMFMR
jgi:hypothetical protein